MPKILPEGWYLMTTAELEQELARLRGRDVPAPNPVPLTIEQALDYRDNGNLPDEQGRTLRLVLHVGDRSDLRTLDAKRMTFEPDHHDPPDWRRSGSVPVNVVPLRTNKLEPAAEQAWWDDPELAGLEEEWAESGTVAGIKVPGAYRGFVYKTVVALRAAGLEITVDAISGSTARWVPEQDAARLRAALEKCNPV
jgi:hypothetical protein